jgi:hypothetical protein
VFQQRRYFFDAATVKFARPHSAKPDTVRSFLRQPGHQVGSPAFQEAERLFGRNKFVVPRPELLDLFREQV